MVGKHSKIVNKLRNNNNLEKMGSKTFNISKYNLNGKKLECLKILKKIQN